MNGSLRDDLLAIWQAGLAGVAVDRLMRETVRLEQGCLVFGDLIVEPPRRLIVVGAGKGAGAMAAALETILAPLIDRHETTLTGWANVPDDCVRKLRHITLFGARPAGLNEPTATGVEGSRQMVELLDRLESDDLCVCLLTGGGSALLPAPIPEITWEEKSAVTRFLSAAGANIEQLNTVRKPLSRLKGGGLARRCRSRRLVTLILSDILGDPLDLIASGPTVPSRTGPAEALDILKQFEAPFPRLLKILEAKKNASAAAEPECEVHNILIGNNAVAVDEAGIEAVRRGYAYIMQSAKEPEGEAESVGRSLLRFVLGMRDDASNDRHHGTPNCLISGGEPVVRLVPPEHRGLGGRNQQLVLAALIEWLERGASTGTGDSGIAFLSCGTDGEDGPTDAAGAFFDADVLAEMRRLELDPRPFLERNDAYHFFEQVGSLIKTGPTGTNVCDLRVALVRRPHGNDS